MASGHVNRANEAEHMAAPHRICDVKIFLANLEPSTHDPSRHSLLRTNWVAFGVKRTSTRQVTEPD
jgi:hypothetical protein